jgi:hypothetical protein
MFLPCIPSPLVLANMYPSFLVYIILTAVPSNLYVHKVLCPLAHLVSYSIVYTLFKDNIGLLCFIKYPESGLYPTLFNTPELGLLFLILFYNVSNTLSDTIGVPL